MNGLINNFEIKKVNCCNSCENWWHLKNVNAFKTECIVCWEYWVHMEEIDIKEMLWNNYYYFENIKEILQEDFFSVIKSFSSYWVTFKSAKIKNVNNRIDWMKKWYWFNKLDLETQMCIKTDIPLSWNKTEQILSDFYIYKK